MKSTLLKLIKNPKVAWAFALCVLFITYQNLLLSYIYVPANDANGYPGWWSWFDQGHYLESAQDIHAGLIDPAKHFYPPLYPLIGSLFLGLTPQHPFYWPNLLLLLSYSAIYLLFMQNYIGLWLAIITLLAGTIVMHPIALQWVTPWTSTLSATLLIIVIYQLDKFIRYRNSDDWRKNYWPTNLSLFGFCIAALVPTRPSDAIAALPLVITYGIIVIHDFIKDKFNRRKTIIIITTGIIVSLIPFIGFLIFNLYISGHISGPYVNKVMNIGFSFEGIGVRFFSHILDSHPLYDEIGADWLSVIPFSALSLAFLVTSILIAPLPFRIAAISSWIALIVAYSYVDIVPTGTFRYGNIHYFKWFIPISFGLATYQIAGLRSGDKLRRHQSIWAIIGVIIIAIGSLSLKLKEQRTSIPVGSLDQNINLVLPQQRTDFIDFIGVDGARADIYFSVNCVVKLNNINIISPGDYHLYPIPGGMRLVFVKPVFGGVLAIDLGNKIKVLPSLNNAVEAASLSFTVAAPWRYLDKSSAANYPIGTELNFSAGSNSTEPYLGSGWSESEAWGRWIDGSVGELHMNLLGSTTHDMELTLSARSFLLPGKQNSVETEVYANNCNIGRLNVSKVSEPNITFKIPALCYNGGPLTLVFRNLNPLSPKSLGVSHDSRLLGIGLVSLKISRLRTSNNY